MKYEEYFVKLADTVYHTDACSKRVQVQDLPYAADKCLHREGVIHFKTIQ